MFIRPWLASSLILLSSVAAQGAGSYDILFRTGTLDALAPGVRILYDQSGGAASGGSPAPSAVDLRVTVASATETHLDLVEGERSRRIGVFPTEVGNPLLMYALEIVVRDLAELSGGSPFYIRNRLKDAIAGDAVPETVSVRFDGTEIGATRVTLHPFRDDPNADRVPGLDELELVVDASDEVPGWYHSISVRMPAAGGYAYDIAVVGEATQ